MNHKALAAEVELILDKIEERLADGKVVAYRMETAIEDDAPHTRFLAITSDTIEEMLAEVNADFGIMEVGDDDEKLENARWGQKLQPRLHEGVKWCSTPWTILVAGSEDARRRIAQGLLVPSTNVGALEVDLVLLYHPDPSIRPNDKEV